MSQYDIVCNISMLYIAGPSCSVMIEALIKHIKAHNKSFIHDVDTKELLMAPIVHLCIYHFSARMHAYTGVFHL